MFQCLHSLVWRFRKWKQWLRMLLSVSGLLASIVRSVKFVVIIFANVYTFVDCISNIADSGQVELLQQTFMIDALKTHFISLRINVIQYHTICYN